MDKKQSAKKALWQQLDAILTEAATYERAIGKLSFDMECCAPPEGLEQAGEDMSVLSLRHHKLTHSKKYINILTALHSDPSELTDLQKKVVEHLWDDYAKTKNLSDRFVYEFSLAQNTAYGAWLEAKKTSDWSGFAPKLETICDFTCKAADKLDEKPATYYTACLDDYEKGGNEPQLDAFFAALKKRIVPLMQKIMKEGKSIRSDFLTRPCPIPQQEKFSRWLLQQEGLRKSALVLMTTEHPFTTNFGQKDVRVTTHYYENNFISNIFSTLHEGGHALFMQNEPDEFYRLHLSDRMSNAMHECISRFYENIIGRSRGFIHYMYPQLCSVCPDVLDGVSEEELYEGVNIVSPSLIRTEADELTYSLHILIRYEIEKELVNRRITVQDIPALWNAKYKEYLGVDVPNDAQGCLQDVHWTFGFGYFPSYALGNAYGAQILRRMRQDIDVDAAVENGELNGIRDWLKENVFSIAGITTPDEWIRTITGESLNVNYYLDYLEDKYTDIYDLR